MSHQVRDKSRDGIANKLEFAVLTGLPRLWKFVNGRRTLAALANKALVNSSIKKIPKRPYPLSTMADYSSWDSLTDRTWWGRHLPPDPSFNAEDNLPPVDKVVELFRKRNGQTIWSTKSTLLFPTFVQWFTHGFLRTARDPYEDPCRPEFTLPQDGLEKESDEYKDQLKRIRRRTTSNHMVDLCTVYGLNKASTDMLRSGVGGTLKSQMINGEENPHYFYDKTSDDGRRRDVVKPEFDGLYEPTEIESRLFSADRRAKCFAMGEETGNVQVGFVAFNVLCLREHNRLCKLMAERHRDWDDERLFQTARNTVMVVVMKIVVEEYINHITPYHFDFIVDPLAFADAPWYRQTWMTLEFNMVYRWHSAQPELVKWGGKPIPERGRPTLESLKPEKDARPVIDGVLLNNQLLIDRGLGATFEEMSFQPSGRIGLHNTPSYLIDWLPVEQMTIQWGRDSELASYNDYRELCKFPRVTDFSQITSDPELQQELRDVYDNDVDKVEFYVGLYAEDVRPNSALPPLVGRLVGIDAFSQAFTCPLLAEHLFNEKTFSDVGWEAINTTTTLSQLVHRNIPQADGTFEITFDRDPGTRPVSPGQSLAELALGAAIVLGAAVGLAALFRKRT